MDALAFFVSPIGILMLLSLIGALGVSIGATRQALLQQRKAYDALIAQAKKRALRKVTVAVELRRRADSLAPLIEQLAGHGYAKLEVLVVVYHTAGKNAVRDLNLLAKTCHVTITTVRHRKGAQFAQLVAEKATGDYVMTMSARQVLSDGFFDKVCYAFASDVDALVVRRAMLPGMTLTSAFQALRVVLQQALRGARAQSYDAGFEEGVVVRRTTLRTNDRFKAQHVLFERMALSVDRPTDRVWWVTVLSSVVLVTLGWFVVTMTNFDVLAYIVALLWVVFMIVAGTFVAQATPLTGWQRAQVAALLPFYPFVDAVRIVVRSLVILVQMLIAVLRRSR